MEHEALKLALVALEESQTDNDTMEFWDRKSKAITAIKAALAQPAQELYDQTALELCNVCGWKTLIPDDGCLNCERKAPPAQEPVARVTGVYGGRFTYEPLNRAVVLPIGMALYAGPPAQEKNT